MAYEPESKTLSAGLAHPFGKLNEIPEKQNQEDDGWMEWG